MRAIAYIAAGVVLALSPIAQASRAKRIFERLRDEHGLKGGITIVKDYVAGWRQRALGNSFIRRSRFTGLSRNHNCGCSHGPPQSW